MRGEFTRVYRAAETSPQAHLRADDPPGYILCLRLGEHASPGYNPASMYDGEVWRGTGNQAEYDNAAHLPLCGECAAIAGARRKWLRP